MFDILNFNFNDRNHKQNEIRSIANRPFNIFDEASNQSYIALKEKIENFATIESELSPKLSNYVEENNGVPTPDDLVIIDEIMGAVSDQFWATEHLNALSEMKVVYQFKNIEITMKSLIQTAYPKTNTKEFYKWESMVTYFKSIDIVISAFNGYNEATQLRKVNNAIKHNDEINDEIKKIPEFASQSTFAYRELELFYNRVKPKVESFIKELGEAIIKDLFIFDNARIEKIGADFKDRMDKASLKNLSDKLIS